jgi:hypothetical protein
MVGYGHWILVMMRDYQKPWFNRLFSLWSETNNPYFDFSWIKQSAQHLSVAHNEMDLNPHLQDILALAFFDRMYPFVRSLHVFLKRVSHGSWFGPVMPIENSIFLQSLASSMHLVYSYSNVLCPYRLPWGMPCCWRDRRI